MSASSVVLKSGGTDAIKRVLLASTEFGIDSYEKSSGKKIPAEVKAVLLSFVGRYVGLMLPMILTGKLEKTAARDVLIEMFKTAGLADRSGWANCGIACFSIGVTAYDAARSTVAASRVAGIATASGVGAAPAAALVAATFLYGVFVTLKDVLDARASCDQAIASEAETEKRPAAVIDGRGYGLGQIAITVGNSRGANSCLMADPNTKPVNQSLSRP